MVQVMHRVHRCVTYAALTQAHSLCMRHDPDGMFREALQLPLPQKARFPVQRVVGHLASKVCTSPFLLPVTCTQEHQSVVGP